MYNEFLDLIYLQWMILSTSTMFAITGITFIHVSHSETEFLGFIPRWIERRYGASSKTYKLFTCANCMAGQTAIWLGLPFVFEWGLYRYAAQVVLAIFIVPVFRKFLATR